MVDHVTPMAMGGSDDPSNLVAACRPCNDRKAQQEARQARELQRRRVGGQSKILHRQGSASDGANQFQAAPRFTSR